MIDTSRLQPSWVWQIGFEGPEPDVKRRVKRMFCLAALTISSSCIRDTEEEGAKPELLSIQSWVLSQADSELNEHERQLLTQEPSMWSSRDLINSSWTFQAAAMIGWSLGLTQWKSIWESYGPDDFDFIFKEADVEKICSICKPKTTAEIELKDSVVCAWLWRCRQQRTEPKRNLLGKMRWKKYLRTFARWMDDSGQFESSIRGDFNLNGVAFFAVSQDERTLLESRATERLRGLNWVLGPGRAVRAHNLRYLTVEGFTIGASSLCLCRTLAARKSHVYK